MKKFLNENSGGEKMLFERRLENRKKNFEIGRHLEDGRASQAGSKEDRKLKNLLKRATETEFAPQSLVDSIRRGIRRETDAK